MTTERRPFPTTPTDLGSQATPIGRATHAQAAQALAGAAMMAATGLPDGSFYVRRVRRNAALTREVYFRRTSSSVKYLRLQAVVGAYANVDTLAQYVTIALSITDGTNTVAASDARVPLAFNTGGPRLAASLLAPASRTGNLVPFYGVLDLDALATTLTASATWRFRFDVATNAGGSINLVVELIRGDELPRFVVDDADAYGARAGVYQDREPIRDLAPVGAAAEGGYLAWRTYLDLAWDVDETTPPGAGAIPTIDDGGVALGTKLPLKYLRDSGGAALKLWVRPRRLQRLTTKVLAHAQVRYTTQGTDFTAVEVIYTTSVGEYAETLAYSATWATSAGVQIQLDPNLTAGADYVTVRARFSHKDNDVWVGTLFVRDDTTL